MMKLNRFRHNLLILLLAVALGPLIGRQLVMFIVPARVVYSNVEGSVSRSLKRSFSRTFLHQLNCQSLESAPKVSKPKPKVAFLRDFGRVVSCPKTVIGMPRAVFGQNVFSSEGSIPLRI